MSASQLIPRILAALEASGTRGMIQTQIAEAAGGHPDTISNVLKRLGHDGVIGWHLDPVGRCCNRRRYWLTENRPERQPKPSGLPVGKPSPAPQQAKVTTYVRADGVRVTRHAGWQHDPRYSVKPGAVVEGAGFARLGVGKYLED